MAHRGDDAFAGDAQPAADDAALGVEFVENRGGRRRRIDAAGLGIRRNFEFIHDVLFGFPEASSKQRSAILPGRVATTVSRETE